MIYHSPSRPARKERANRIFKVLRAKLFAAAFKAGQGSLGISELKITCEEWVHKIDGRR